MANTNYVRHDKDGNVVDPQPSYTTVNQFDGAEGWTTRTFRNYSGDYVARDKDGNTRTPGTFQARSSNGDARTPAAYQRHDKDGNAVQDLMFLEYTTASVSSFRIRTVVSPNYDVDWGDGSTETGITTIEKDHTYSTAGVYTIKITPASGSTFRAEQYGVPNFGTSLTKVDGTGGSELGTNLTKWLREHTTLTSFGVVDVSSVENFQASWRGCSGLTTFPALDYSSATNFAASWQDCTSLTTFPANRFDSTGTLVSTAFNNSWLNCALSAQSIENILTSLDTNGTSNITLVISGGTNAAKSTWTTAANTAYTNLVNKGWTISYNS